MMIYCYCFVCFFQKELVNLKVIELKVCQLETDVFRMDSTFDQVLKHSFDLFLQIKKIKMLSLSFQRMLKVSHVLYGLEDKNMRVMADGTHVKTLFYFTFHFGHFVFQLCFIFNFHACMFLAARADIAHRQP